MTARSLAHFGVRCSMLDVRCFPWVRGFQRANFHFVEIPMNRPLLLVLELVLDWPTWFSRTPPGLFTALCVLGLGRGSFDTQRNQTVQFRRRMAQQRKHFLQRGHGARGRLIISVADPAFADDGEMKQLSGLEV